MQPHRYFQFIAVVGGVAQRGAQTRRRGKWSLSTPYPAGSMSSLTTWRGSDQLGAMSMIRYSVAGVSRTARQVSWASARRTDSTCTFTICC